MKKNWLIAACVATLLASFGSAHGQSLDYGALEQLFGEPVTTSVTGSPQRVSDVPATMQIITADDIRRSGSRDIPGVLRHLADIDVLQWTNDDADLSVRGYDQVYSPRLLVLVNGRQVYADYYGFTPWSAIPVELSDIRQIEVVEGPNSALFGFNAVGGVINIITYNPLYDDINKAAITGGTQGLAQGSAIGTFKVGDRAALRISAGGYRDDDFSTPIPPGMSSASRGGEYRGAVDLDGIVRLGQSAELRLEASHSQVQQNEVIPGYTFSTSRYESGSAMARLSAETSVGIVRATAYSNWLQQVTPTASGLGELHNQVTVLQLQDIAKIGADHTVRASFEYRHDTVDTTPFSGAAVFYDVVAAGGIWVWNIAPSLSITNAFRLDSRFLGRDGPAPPGYPFGNADWNRTLVEPSFNSGLVWHVDAENTFRLLASRGVQIPSLVQNGAFVSVSPFVGVTGSPTLAPTVVTNYGLDWDRALPRFEARLRLTAFEERTTDIVSDTGATILTPTIPYAVSTNVGDSTANGLELGLGGRLAGHWRWNIGDRAEFVTDHLAPGLSNLAAITDFQHTTPADIVTGHVSWSEGRWEADGFLRYQTRSFGFLPSGASFVLTPISDYVALDARIGYRLTERVSLALSGQNLAFATQTQTSGPKVERRILGTITVGF